MRKKITVILCIITTVFLAQISCKLVEDNDATSKGVYILKLDEGAISPWVQSKDGYDEFKATTLFGVINGGDEYYVDEGLVEGFRQIMSNSPKEIQIFIMDFGTANSATAMYKKIDGENSDRSALGDYDNSIAGVDNSALGSIKAYAHFDKYYLELDYTEYDTEADAQTTLRNFIEVFQVRIAQLK